MDIKLWLEMIGYLGSMLVAISLMMKSLLRLRLVNLLGAVAFVAYGLLIRAYPVAFMNALIVSIDLYYLVQMWRQHDYFTLLEVSPDSPYLRHFVSFHQADIRQFLPDFSFAPASGQLIFFVLRNMVPAGLFIAQPQGETAHIILDYVIPGYRDFRIGHFLFEENAAFFHEHGVSKLISPAGNSAHTKYLLRMGFQQDKYSSDFIYEISNYPIRDTSL